jgi:omega-6 fatty acid desaturase (delta-12 desaturase)
VCWWQYHHIHHFSTRVPSYLIRACHDSAPPGLWRYVKYLDFKTELQSLLLVMWNPDTHRFESFPDLNWLLRF